MNDHDLNDLAVRLERMEGKLDHMGRAQELLIREQETQNIAIRALQDWRLGLEVYLRQVKWAVALAAGAVIVGVANILLELAQH